MHQETTSMPMVKQTWSWNWIRASMGMARTWRTDLLAAPCQRHTSRKNARRDDEYGGSSTSLTDISHFAITNLSFSLTSNVMAFYSQWTTLYGKRVSFT